MLTFVLRTNMLSLLTIAASVRFLGAGENQPTKSSPDHFKTHDEILSEVYINNPVPEVFHSTMPTITSDHYFAGVGQDFENWLFVPSDDTASLPELNAKNVETGVDHDFDEIEDEMERWIVEDYEWNLPFGEELEEEQIFRTENEANYENLMSGLKVQMERLLKLGKGTITIMHFKIYVF